MHRRALLVFAVVLASWTPLGRAAESADTAGPRDARLPPGVTPIDQSVHLWIDPQRTDYRGDVVIDVEVAAAVRTIWLNARGLTVERAVVKVGAAERVARFSAVDEVEGVARLDVDEPVPAGRATLELTYAARLRDDLHGLYRVESDGRAYAFTQFEALSAREAFPCFDEPAFKIPFSVTITHKRGDVAVANTRATRVDAVGDEITTRFADTAPLPTYLLAFAVGPLDVVQGPVLPPSDVRATALPLRGVAPRGKGGLLTLSLQRTAQVVVDQERAFGLAYPYDKLDLVAVPDFGAGAMENAGLITYRDTLVYVDDTSPIGAHKGNLGVIAHELAHQWFGNLVTMAWWDDLWLNEAFATWMSARTVARVRPDFDATFRLRESGVSAVGDDALQSARKIREPIKNRGDIENAFDGITYSKGAAVIAMFEEWIDRERGAGTFMRGVRAYLLAHRHGSGTTADFLAAISQEAGVDVAGPFSTFLDQPGAPLVRASCEVAGGKARLAVAVERFVPNGGKGTRAARYALPICAKNVDSGEVRCALIDGKGVVDLGVARCPVVHPNADGAGYYRVTLPAAQQAALLARASKLTPGEKLAAGLSLRTAFQTASMTLTELDAAAAPLAQEPEPGLLSVPARFIEFSRDYLAKDARAVARDDARLVALYGAQLTKAGFKDVAGETPRDAERRARLAWHLWEADAALRTSLAAEGRAWLTARHERLARDLVPTALAAHVREHVTDAAGFDALLARAKAEADPRARGWILQALASTQVPALRERALALTFDTSLRVNERGMGLWGQGSDPSGAAGATAFMRARYDDIAAALPEDWRSGFPGVAAALCAEADAVALEAFFGPKVASVPGLDRGLAQAAEEIRLCAARVADYKK